MEKYQRGKVYEIVCRKTGLRYIGSTCEPTLARRLAKHVSDFKCWEKGKKNYVTSYNIIKNGDYYIVLLESYPCNSCDELRMCEQKHINLNECINHLKAFQSKEELNEYCKEYHNQHRDEKKEKAKQYREQHKEQIAEKKKEYREQHHDEIIEKAKQHRQQHHDEIIEKVREYREQHKDKIREYVKNYYQKNKEKINAKRRERNQKSCSKSKSESESTNL
jgi:hypothetical protein